MSGQHGEIVSESDIPDLCKSIFFNKENLYRMIWVLVILFVGGYGAVVAYAINNSSAVSKLESENLANKSNIEFLNTQVNSKLDIIVNKISQ